MARYANARTAEEYREAAKGKSAPKLIAFMRNYGTEGQRGGDLHFHDVRCNAASR